MGNDKLQISNNLNVNKCKIIIWLHSVFLAWKLIHLQQYAYMTIFCLFVCLLIYIYYFFWLHKEKVNLTFHWTIYDNHHKQIFRFLLTISGCFFFGGGLSFGHSGVIQHNRLDISNLYFNECLMEWKSSSPHKYPIPQIELHPNSISCRFIINLNCFPCYHYTVKPRLRANSKSWPPAF